VDPQDALTTLAEISIAIAGFSGIAAVLGRRSQGDWEPEDAFRLRLLLRSSFSIVIFCFVPIVLSSASVAAEKTWALSSSAWLVYFVTISLPINLGGARRLTKVTGERVEGKYILTLVILATGLVVLHTANVLVIRDAWPYLAALVATLVLPFTQFLRLLRGVLQSPGAV